MEHTEDVSKAAGAPSALNVGLGVNLYKDGMTLADIPKWECPRCDAESGAYCVHGNNDVVYRCFDNGHSCLVWTISENGDFRYGE